MMKFKRTFNYNFTRKEGSIVQDASGNVGIGVTAPTARLHVNVQPDTVQSGLLFYAPLDNHLYDVAGQNVGGIPLVTGAVQFNGTGKVGASAILVNAIAGTANNSVAYPLATTLLPANGGTASVWVRPYASTAGSSTALQLADAGGNAVMVLSLTSTLVTATFYPVPGTLGTFAQATLATSISANTWYHLACTVGGGNIMVYVNGTAGTMTTGAYAVYTAAASALWVGSSPAGGSAFHGEVDELRLYGRALTGAEVTALVAAGNTNPTPASMTLYGINNTSPLTASASGVRTTGPLQVTPYVNMDSVVTNANTLANTLLVNTQQVQLLDFGTYGYNAAGAVQGTASASTLGPFPNVPSEGSILFPGVTGSYLDFGRPGGLTFNWSSSSFTAEFWLNLQAVPSGTTYPCVLGRMEPVLNSNGDWDFFFGGSALYFLYNTAANGAQNLPIGNIPLNTWVHVAVSYNGTNLFTSLNGTVSAAIARVGTPNFTATYNFVMGQMNRATFHGYVSNVRIVTGAALYTSNFTVPTTPLTPAASGTTVLLLRAVQTPSTVLSLTSGGRVGIGTTAPATTNALTVQGGVTSNLQPDNITGLQVYLPFENNLMDAAGQGVLAGPTVTGGVTYNETGRVGSSVVITNPAGGTAANVVSYALNQPLLASNYTFAFWCKPFAFGTINVPVQFTGDLQDSTAVEFSFYNNAALNMSIQTVNGGVDQPYPHVPMTANTFGGYVASASSSAVSGPFATFGAFDKNTGTSWLSNGTYNTTTGVYTGALNTNGVSGEHLQIQLPFSIIMKRYEITPRSDAFATRSPQKFSIFGSMDGNSWTLLDNIENQTWTTAKIIFFIPSNITPFSYYRIVVNIVGNSTETTNRGAAGIAEWELFGQGATSATYVSTYSTNVWHHVAGTVTSNALTLFYNGAQVATTSYNSTPIYLRGLTLGCKAPNTLPFNGELDELRVYNRVLSATEISTLYNMGTTMPSFSVTGSNNNAVYAATAGGSRVGSALQLANNTTITGGINPTYTATISTSLIDTTGTYNNMSSFTTGSVPISANSPFPATMNEGSIYFNGNVANYISIANGSGGSNFVYSWWTTGLTVECFVNVAATPSGYTSLAGSTNAPSGSQNWALVLSSTRQVGLFYYNGTSNVNVMSAATLNLNTWYHVAVTSDATGNIRVFINGAVAAGPTAFTGTPGTAVCAFSMGVLFNVTFTGFLSNLRVVTGAALYTSAFTAPAGPLGLATSGTTRILLRVPPTTSIPTTTPNVTTIQMSQPQAILDMANLYNPVSTYVTGSAPVSTYSPIPNEGSFYLNGVAGNYLSFTASALRFNWWTTQMTCECWVNYQSFAGASASNGSPTLVGAMLPSAGNNWSFGADVSSNLVFYYYTGTLMYVRSNSVLNTNTWYHVAVTCDVSANIRLFVNGALVGSAAVSGTPLMNQASQFTIGQFNNTNTCAYVSNLRYVSGAALYTASFMPPTTTLGTSPSGTTQLLLRVPATPNTAMQVSGDGRLFANRLGGSLQVQAYPPAALTGTMTNLQNVAYGKGYYIVSASSEFVSNSSFSWKAFDRVNTNIWQAGNGANASGTSYNPTSPFAYNGTLTTLDISGNAYAGEWLQIQLPLSITLSHYTIDNLRYNFQGSASSFAMLGSRDGSNWYMLNAQSGVTTSGTYTVAQPIPCCYFRLVIRNINAANINGAHVGDLYLYGTPEALTINSDGRVGLGVHNPAQALEVAGNVIVNGSLSAPNMFMGRNRIINGDMRVDQRDSSNNPVTTSGAFATDRYYLATLGISAGLQQAVLPSPLPGFQRCLRFYITSTKGSLATNDYTGFEHKIEGLNMGDMYWGTIYAQPVTVSFWVYSSITGTFVVALRNGNATRSYVSNVVVATANVWQYVTIVVPGETTGTWATNNILGLILNVLFVAGSTFHTTAGVWQAGNFFGTSSTTNFAASLSNVYVTGLQLERGAMATSFEFRPYAVELALCQRYYEVVLSSIALANSMMGTYSGGTATNLILPFKVPKRATPSIATGSIVAGIGTIYNTVINTEAITVSITAGAGSTFFYTINTPLAVSAEL
jgi:hypothetical protein